MCADCAVLREALEHAHESEKALMAQIEALQAQSLRTAMAERAARAELTKHREDSPRAKEIREVLTHYVQVFHKTKAYKVGTDTARWKAVDRMLRIGYTVEELIEAIDGLRALPFVGPKGRQAEAGAGAERHDDITLCFRDETHVDRFRGYLVRAKAREQLAVPVPTRPIDRWLDALDETGVRWRGSVAAMPQIAWESQCPLHLDPGFAVTAQHNDDGELVVSCSAGCAPEGILQAFALDAAAMTAGAHLDWISARFRLPARLEMAA